jgi:GT2 family glycosyltransferase
VLEDIGLIPEDYFLYFEETDWCTRARRAGLKLMVFPDIVTKHWKASEKDGLPQPYYFYYFIRSSLLFARKYTSDGVVQSAANQQEFIDGWMRKIGKIAPGATELAQDIGRAGRRVAIGKGAIALVFQGERVCHSVIVHRVHAAELAAVDRPELLELG